MFKPTHGEERTQILYRAFSRSGGKPRSYAGYVTPQEAQRLAELGAAKIVDLRTAFEREYVGHVPDTLHVEWLPLGSTEPNPGFIEGIAVAVDWAVLPRSQWHTELADGARVEVLTAVQGG